MANEREAPTNFDPVFVRSDVIIDVGANRGDFAVTAAARNPSTTVFAIEPITELAAAIEARAAYEGLTNVICMRLAIDDVVRHALFHVSTEFDQGISSLLDFDADAISINEYWQYRADLHFTNEIEVQVERMDTALPWDTIERVSFIKIDAQGRDMAVLRSFGVKLDRVDGGMLEVPAVRSSRLYRGVDVDLAAAVTELKGMGFDVYALKPNDHAANEFNLFFCRQGTDWRKMEARLALRGMAPYDGKHYWHLPGNRLINYEADLADAALSRERLAGAFEAALAARLEADRLTAKESEWRRQLALEIAAKQDMAMEIANLQQAVVTIMASRSMRLTRPLRGLVGRLRRRSGSNKKDMS